MIKRGLCMINMARQELKVLLEEDQVPIRYSK